MATTMNRRNISIIVAGVTLTHWDGDIEANSGGKLRPIDESPVGGPPARSYDETGNDRDPYEFPVTTKVLGADATAQNAFIAQFKKGTIIPAANISIPGLETGIDWMITDAPVRHSAEGEDPSMITMTISEIGQAAGGGGGGG